MVNYRREMSFGYVQSYPLPTPSMVRGLCHALLDLHEYCPLKVGIQGTSEGVVTNMQRVYKFDRGSDRPNNPYYVDVEGSRKTATHGIMFVDELIHVNLILHIAFEDESLTARLEKAFWHNVVVLGRNEDFARIDDVQTVELMPLEEYLNEKELAIKDYIYLSRNFAEVFEKSGTVYRLPFKYAELDRNGKDHFKQKRIFEYCEAVYHGNFSISEDDVSGDVPASSFVDNGEYLVDLLESGK